MKLSSIKSWFSNLRKHYHESQDMKRAAHLAQLSCEKINVVEFNGYIYVAYGGVPVVKTDNLNIPVTKLLEEARTEYLMWKEKFER